MKTQITIRRSRSTRRNVKKLQMSVQSSSSFYHHEFIETPQCPNAQYNYIMCSTIESLHSQIKLKQQQKTCANKLCANYIQNEQERNIEIKMDNLCTQCQKQFKNESYCLHCKQIYFDNTDDGKEWIMCETCQKWVHTSCANVDSKENINSVFKCIKCKKVDIQINVRKNPSRGNNQKVDKRKTFEFINTLGFQWQLNPIQISDDMEKIRKYLIQN